MEYLIKIGEISLKGGNRKLFEKQLKRNILKSMPKGTNFFGNTGRFFISNTGLPEKEIEKRLSKIFGITGFGPVVRTEKSIEIIEQETVRKIGETVTQFPGYRKFKVESRRSDKGFPLDSYQIACRLGDTIRNNFPNLSVDLKNPDFTLRCEIRDKALIFIDGPSGLGGLPVGCAGKGTLLLSGGIDSPVAGFLMAKRGLKLDAVYFHTPPFTSDGAKKKVEDLAQTLSPYCAGIRLITVPFTEVQLHIAEHGRKEAATLLMRACMMKIGEMAGKQFRTQCIVTGESLSQVASQTVESLTFTGSFPSVPVFRPLIGYDKEEIIGIAKNIGTFEISIRPYDDCCTIFAPSRPLVKPVFEETIQEFEQLGIEPLLEKAVENIESKLFSV